MSDTQVQFSEADINTREGRERWHELIGREVLDLELELLPGHPFMFQFAARFLPDVGIATATQSGLRMTRRRTPHDDSLSLHVPTSGVWGLAHRGATLALEARSASLVHNGETAAVTCTGRTSSVCIQFPRRAMNARVRHVSDLAARPLRGEALALLRDYLEWIQARPAPSSSALAQAQSTHILDLIALALCPSRDTWRAAETGGGRAARLYRIKKTMQTRAHEHDLSVGAVAALHGVTSRYVQQLFEREGITFSQHLLELRLQAVHRRLVDPTASSLAIAAIAYDAGFADLSYFNRTFKRRFGARPSEIRMASALSRRPLH